MKSLETIAEQPTYLENDLTSAKKSNIVYNFCRHANTGEKPRLESSLHKGQKSSVISHPVSNGSP